MTKTDALAKARAARQKARGSNNSHRIAVLSAEVRRYISDIPQSYQSDHRKSLEGKSKAAALRAKCRDCCNWDRTEVSSCTVQVCPLWPYRPYQKKGNRFTDPADLEVRAAKVVVED